MKDLRKNQFTMNTLGYSKQMVFSWEKMVIGFLLFSSLSFGQNNKAIITYKMFYATNSITGKRIDSVHKGMFMSYMDMMQEESKNLQFTLKIKNQESLFKLDKQLSTSRASSAKKVLGGGTIYVNSQSEEVLNEISSFGEPFLVSRALNDRNWTITNEIKMIGNYLCYKATSVKIVKTFIRVSEHPIEAWFAPEIPFRFGPSKYYGLPGLILEVTCHNTKFYASNIQLNPASKLTIKRPNRGKKVTRAELDVLEEKMAMEYIKSKTR